MFKVQQRECCSSFLQTRNVLAVFLPFSGELSIRTLEFILKMPGATSSRGVACFLLLEAALL